MSRSLSVLALALLALAPLAAAATISVSPGSPDEAVEIRDGCPTFSWAAAPDAGGYELVAYRLADDGSPGTTPALEQRFPAGVTGWTPARCLAPGGRYAWSVRALGSGAGEAWSEARLFSVSRRPSLAEVEEALAVLRRFLKDGEPPRRQEESGAAAAHRSGAREPEGFGTSPNRGAAATPRSRDSDRLQAASPSGIVETATPSTASPASLSVDSWIDLGASPHLRMSGGDEILMWTDSSNVALGPGAAESIVIGQANTALGAGALEGFTTTHSHTAIGYMALNAGGGLQDNTAVGYKALVRHLNGANNIALGSLTLSYLTEGSNNIAIGVRAGELVEFDSEDPANWNIYIGNEGPAHPLNTESHRIRIGTPFDDAPDPDEGHLYTFIAGKVALGTEGTPQNQLVVKESVDGVATPTNHVALIENTDTAGSADVMALKIAEPGELESDNNFVTFFNGDDAVVGQIEGGGALGVNYLGGYVTLVPTDSPLACTSGRAGMLYFDASMKRLCFCDGFDWRNVIDAVGCT